MEHPQYTVNFAGAPMSIYDIDDLMRRAWENEPFFPFTKLVLAPDLKENLREALFHIRQPEPGNFEIHEVKNLKMRWGSVDVEVDETLPMHHMTLR
jgi:hypothetical protein